MVKKCNKFLEEPNDANYEAILKTNNRINHSFITDQVENLIKEMYPSKTFQINGYNILQINKCVLSSDFIRFKNGESFKGPITLITAYSVKPQEYLDSGSCSLLTTSKKGFIEEKIWQIKGC